MQSTGRVNTSFPLVVLMEMLVIVSSSASAAEKDVAPPTFEKNVAPVFEAKCLRCHGGEKQKAGLDLRSPGALLKGGETGPSISPGSSSESLLWEKVNTDKMPPGKVKLSKAEKTALRAWIDSVVKRETKLAPASASTTVSEISEADRQFWSFRKPIRPPVPPVRHGNQVRNPIDAFLLNALEKKNLTLSPEADRLTLLRRAYFDLIGLPPPPEEIERFRNDPASDAYEQLIDRLLASSHYGERWGRHWLDLAGYADSEGILSADYVRSAAWRYRDYVIQAFNHDKPYDRFLKEQLAGDELTDYWTAYHTQKTLSPEVVEGLIATGFLRCASDTSRPDFKNIKNAPGYYFQTLDDTVKIVASSILGLTVQCAKCHSHKYDPIPQSDYYRVQAVFMSAYRPYQWIPQEERHLFETTEFQEKENAKKNAIIQASLKHLEQEVKSLRASYAQRYFREKLAKLPEAIREDVRLSLATGPGKRNEVQKYLAAKFELDLKPQGKDFERSIPPAYPDFRNKLAALKNRISVEESKLVKPLEIRALYDLPGKATTHLLRRGDYQTPGPELGPGALALVSTARDFHGAFSALDQQEKSRESSGRRLAFAEWATQPDHPLTTRVLVNRLWLHHFGEGIVSTPDNFGHIGAAPTHPELLDWLATEFVNRGWSIKTMHRLIMTSHAYRQVSAIQGPGSAIDPTNRLLWRQRLRRLEAETLRDAILSTSGDLNPRMFGVPVPMHVQADGEVVAAPGNDGRRRSVYLQVRRSEPLSLLQAFDQPVMETNCTRRANSTVASQALTLLNSEFMDHEAENFAGRLLREHPADPVAHAVLAALGRPVSPKEQRALEQFLKSQTKRYRESSGKISDVNTRSYEPRALIDLCHMLLGANEFAYVD